MTKTCETCGFMLPRDQPHPTHQRSYAVATCLHPRIRNNHGVLSVKIARDVDGRCGPDAALWVQRKARSA